MSIKSRLCSLGMAAVIFSFTTSGTWAASTVCTTKTNGTGTSTTRIAVASNFYGPAQELVTAFQGTTAGANTAITICQNSTAHLLNEINNGIELPSSAFPTDPGFPRYGLFMAANSSAPTSLQTSTGNIAYTYAYGIPVFFALQSTISSVSGLITGATSSTISDPLSDLSALYSVNTSSAQYVAVASSAAPYGVAAHSILNNMMGTALPNTVPSWVYSTLFSNIDLTYSSVINGTTKSGFVSKAQICDQINGTSPAVTYVEFTNSDIVLDQKAILLKSSTTDPVAAALNSYIQGRMTAGTWNSFLTSNCYGTL